MALLFLFSSPGRSPGRAIVLPPALVLALVLALVVLAKSLTLKFFYVMGKALSDKLSVPVTGLVINFACKIILNTSGYNK